MGTISGWAKDIHELAVLKGWYDKFEDDNAFVERMCNNLHDEVSELHQAWRNGNLNNPCDKAQDMVEHDISPLTCLEEELADIVIRALDDSARLNVDIERAIYIKHQYNKTRPYGHGGKIS